MQHLSFSRRLRVGACFAALPVADFANAQSVSGVIIGSVADPSGAPVPGAATVLSPVFVYGTDQISGGFLCHVTQSHEGATLAYSSSLLCSLSSLLQPICCWGKHFRFDCRNRNRPVGRCCRGRDG